MKFLWPEVWLHWLQVSSSWANAFGAHRGTWGRFEHHWQMLPFHPFLDEFFSKKNHPEIGVPPWLWKPPYWPMCFFGVKLWWPALGNGSSSNEPEGLGLWPLLPSGSDQQRRGIFGDAQNTQGQGGWETLILPRFVMAVLLWWFSVWCVYGISIIELVLTDSRGKKKLQCQAGLLCSLEVLQVACK